MSVFFLPEFLADIKSLESISILERILNRVFDPRFDFIDKNPDDHRYKGITDAWIRDISKGTIPYRVIFIRTGKDIYLYRAGTKKIEEGLKAPSSDQRHLGIADLKVEVSKKYDLPDFGQLVKSPDEFELLNEIYKFSHVKLNEIWLISPFLTKDIFQKTHEFGSFLDRAVEDNTCVVLITRPPNLEDISFFNDLESRGIYIYYCEKLHSKIYYFTIDHQGLSKYQITLGLRNTAIVGSANLTQNGFSFGRKEGNYELCSKIHEALNKDIHIYCNSLISKSTDINKFKFLKKWQ